MKTRGGMLVILAALAVCLFAAPSGAGESIKLGAFFALSGPAGHIGVSAKLVAQMVTDKINKEGGINGRPLQLVIGDTESDPGKAAVIAKKFIFSDKVAAIIGPTSTGEGMSAKKIVEEAGVPTFMTVGGDPVIMGGNFGAYTYVFKSPQRSSTAVQKLFGYLKSKGMTRVALFTNSDGFGKDGLGWLERGAPEFNISFVFRKMIEQVPPFIHQVGGKRVDQAECYELRYFAGIEVRKIPAGVPAFFVREWRLFVLSFFISGQDARAPRLLHFFYFL